MSLPHDQQTVRVWDRLVRLFHWSLVTAFALAWFNTEHIGWLHKGAGYAALALVLVRIVWGFGSPNPYARFAGFVPGPKRLVDYLEALMRGREPRHLGHNPAGAMMILFLLAAVLGIGISGWMLTTDRFWGNEAVEVVHVVLVDFTLVALVLHVLAAVLGSWRHHDNLVWSMITGRKRRQPGDVDAAAPALALPDTEPVAPQEHGLTRRQPV